jgi:hypothetical protein
MAKFNIISKDGTSVKYSGCPRYNGTYMGIGVLEFSEISSPSPIDWEIGDFVDYRNGRFRLYSLPEPKKQARRGEYGASFVYTGVQFHSPVKDLEIALFRDLVTEDNEVHFSTLPDVSTYEDVYGIARRIQECMDDMYPGKWRIEVYESEDEELNALLSETKEFSLSEGTCLDALSLIYDTWKNVGWVHTTEDNREVITIARANVRDNTNTTDSFAYGKGRGLTAVRRASANKDEFATRLYVYGSERNIPPRYYNSKDIKDAESVRIPNLMLPIETWGITNGKPDPRLAYLEADADIVRKYGLIPRVVRFDGSEREDIYPSIEGLTQAQVRQAILDTGHQDKYLPGDEDTRIDEVFEAEIPGDYGNIANADGTTRTDTLETTFLFEAHTFGFNIADQAALAGENSARISMKSGMCAGREFTVKGAEWRGGTWWLTLERQMDDSLNMLFPNQDYPILPGDRFVLLDIAMPEYYITLAQKRMYEEGMKVLADYTRTSAYYEPQIDAMVMHENAIVLREGMYMKVEDEDIVDTANKVDYVIIDSLTIEEKTEIPTYNVTLREQKRAAKGISALEGMIEDAKQESNKEIAEERKHTGRRFNSLQQTVDMIQAAFGDFSASIDPVAVQTMILVAGDSRSQFTFTESKDSLESVPCPIYYDKDTKRVIANASHLVHFTLGVDSVTSANGRTSGDYLSWDLKEGVTERLDAPERSYYICVKAPMDGSEAELYISEVPVAAEVEGYYYFYVGILNSESAGERDFATIYGFTEVAPGRIVTNVIRSADGTCVFDLENNSITGAMKFLPGTSGIENVEGISEAIQGALDGVEFGKYNLIRNSGFTGDYMTEDLNAEKVLSDGYRMFSNPLNHWEYTNVKVQPDIEAESGNVCVMSNGRIAQNLQTRLIVGESYVLSFKAKGIALTYSVGGVQATKKLTLQWRQYTEKFVAQTENPLFEIKTAICQICNLQLERGNVASHWSTSVQDNPKDLAEGYQKMQYLEQAIKDGNTDIIGGLIMSNLLLLGNPGKNDNTAGVSGIRNDESDVAFWGGGTYAQAISTVMKYVEDPTYQPTDAEVASMAKAVITHGGRAILNDIILRGTIYTKKGMLGNLSITEEGIEVKTKQGGRVVVNPSGIILYDRDGNISGSLGYCGGSAISAVGRGGLAACPQDDYHAGVYASSDRAAFVCSKGNFTGLRTVTKVISTTGGTDADNPRHRLTEMDYNALVSLTSGTCYLDVRSEYYDAEIEDGQEYIIESLGASLNIVSGEDNIFVIASGSSYGSYDKPLTSTGKGVFRLKYYKDAHMWTFSKIA